MKIIKTSYNAIKNPASSYKVYLCKTREIADAVYSLMMTAKPANKDGYWCVTTYHTIGKNCIVPEFFHDSNYIAVIVEHNNCDWDAEQIYELFLAE